MKLNGNNPKTKDRAIPIAIIIEDEIYFKVKYEKDGYETKDIRYNFVLDHTGQYNINEKLARSSSSFNSNTLVNNESSSNIDGNNINSNVLNSQPNNGLGF